MEIIHPLSHVAGSEVNGSQPVGSGNLALKGPSDCARDSDWMIPIVIVIERPIGLCLGSLLDDPHLLFFFYLGLKGDPLFLRCPIT